MYRRRLCYIASYYSSVSDFRPPGAQPAARPPPAARLAGPEPGQPASYFEYLIHFSRQASE